MLCVLRHAEFNQLPGNQQAAGLAANYASADFAHPDPAEILLCEMLQYQLFHVALRGHEPVADTFFFFSCQVFLFKDFWPSNHVSYPLMYFYLLKK
ncbi:unknown [Enterocloster bolteae CAG:59]|nr:unknown [Enterocloster bolteae CAG:59]